MGGSVLPFTSTMTDDIYSHVKKGFLKLLLISIQYGVSQHSLTPLT